MENLKAPILVQMSLKGNKKLTKHNSRKLSSVLLRQFMVEQETS